MDMRRAVVKLVRVGKEFNGLKVIEGLDLTVYKGEVVSLIGPSGCGKTTTLRIIAGLERCDEGYVWRNFERAAFIFQETRLLPWRTTLENICFVLKDRILKPEERYSVAKRYLDLVGLTGFEDYYPAQLSGGMRKRLCIARALAIEPDLVLMDEPFSNIDLPLRLLLIDELSEILGKKKLTAIYVTHDVREALLLSHRLYILTARPMRVKEELKIPPEVRERREVRSLYELEAYVTGLVKEETLKLLNEGAPS